MSPLLWTPDAQRGAAHAFGERHYKTWVAARTAPVWVPLAVVAAVVMAFRAYGLPDWSARWPSLVPFAVVVVTLLVLWRAVRRRRRFRRYRSPRSRL